MIITHHRTIAALRAFRHRFPNKGPDEYVKEMTAFLERHYLVKIHAMIVASEDQERDYGLAVKYDQRLPPLLRLACIQSLPRERCCPEPSCDSSRHHAHCFRHEEATVRS